MSDHSLPAAVDVSDPEEDAAFAHPPVPPHETVRYGIQVDQVIDYYHPTTADTPVLILLHGGFWRQRYDRMHLSPMAAHLAASGFTTALVEYRRVGGDGGWPATFDDVAAATDLVISRAGARPVLVAGHSAGGQLALWTAARHQLPPGAPGHRGSPPPLRIVVSVAGVADLAAQLAVPSTREVITGLLGGPDRVADHLPLADPLALLNAHGPTGVPTVLVHGVTDREVSIEQSRAYAERNPSITLHELAAGHYGPIDPDTVACERIVAILRSAAQEP